jgi:hypothetical protein
VPDRDEERLLDELALVFARVALDRLIEETPGEVPAPELAPPPEGAHERTG